MLNCPYCTTPAHSNSGLSAHIRAEHPEQWKGSVKASLPEGHDIGAPEPKKGVSSKKENSRRWQRRKKCPYCSFKTAWLPALASHLKGQHPARWKGTISRTLGYAPTPGEGRKWKSKKRGRRIVSKSQLGSELMVTRQTGPVRGHIDFCPGCGFHITPYEMTAGLVEKAIQQQTESKR